MSQLVGTDAEEVPPPTVQPDQDTGLEEQVSEGSKAMSSMSKAQKPQDDEGHMMRLLAAEGRPTGHTAPPVGANPMMSRGMMGGQGMMGGWPSIFYSGGGAVRAYAMGGGVDDDEPSPESTLYQTSMLENQSGSPSESQGAIPETGATPEQTSQSQQVAMLGGMPRMSSSIPNPRLPSPRMGLGSGSRSSSGSPSDRTGAMPEGMEQEDANDARIPSGTPQMADMHGNPAKGLTDALTSGLRGIIGMFGLGGQGAMQEPGQQQNHEAFIRGEGAMDPEHYNGIMHAVDKRHLLDEGMRNLAGLNAVYEYYMLQGQPQVAQQMAASMLMYGRHLAGQYGDEAIKAFHGGDMDHAFAATLKGFDDIPNGKRYAGQKVGDGQYQIEQRNLHGETEWAATVGPQEILAGALGLHTGIGYWKMLEQTAGQYDPQSKADMAQDEEARRAGMEAGWEPRDNSSAGNGGGGSGGAGNNTPGVIPIRGASSPAPGSPSTAAPQPGPPVSQPSLISQRGTQDTQDAYPEQQIAQIQQQIEAKYYGPNGEIYLNNMVFHPPQPTGNPAVDRSNQQRYAQAQMEVRQMASQELQAQRGDITEQWRIQHEDRMNAQHDKSQMRQLQYGVIKQAEAERQKEAGETRRDQLKSADEDRRMMLGKTADEEKPIKPSDTYREDQASGTKESVGEATQKAIYGDTDSKTPSFVTSSEAEPNGQLYVPDADRETVHDMMNDIYGYSGSQTSIPRATELVKNAFRVDDHHIEAQPYKMKTRPDKMWQVGVTDQQGRKHSFLLRDDTFQDFVKARQNYMDFQQKKGAEKARLNQPTPEAPTMAIPPRGGALPLPNIPGSPPSVTHGIPPQSGGFTKWLGEHLITEDQPSR